MWFFIVLIWKRSEFTSVGSRKSTSKNPFNCSRKKILQKQDTISHRCHLPAEKVTKNQNTKDSPKMLFLDQMLCVRNETSFIIWLRYVLGISPLPNSCYTLLLVLTSSQHFIIIFFDCVNLRIFFRKLAVYKVVVIFTIWRCVFRQFFCISKYFTCLILSSLRLYFVDHKLSRYNLRKNLAHIKLLKKLKNESSDSNFIKLADLKTTEKRKFKLQLPQQKLIEYLSKSIEQVHFEITKPETSNTKDTDSYDKGKDSGSPDMIQALKLSNYSKLWWSRNTTLNLIAYPLHNVSRQPSENPSPSTPAQQNPQTRDMHRLMHFEVFRLCSFSYSRFPPNVNLWVTLLAQSGFYVVNDSGRVRCFSCGYEYEDFLIGSPVDNAHGPQCERHTFNRPLHEWIRGLDRDVLESYYLVFGNLRPYVSDDSENLDHLNSSAQAVLHEDPTHLESGFSETEARQMGGPSLGSADSQDPQSYQRAADAVVYQESQEPQPREVLTSAAQQPVTLDRSANGASADQTHPDAERGATGYTNFDLSLASYPQFAGTSSRRSTFSGWNPEHPQKPDDLVAGGFFYAGYADCVRCFYCGLGLKYWRPDDIPAYQHARFRPNCVYNRMYKGQEYIDRVQQDNQQDAGNNVERNQSQTANPAPQPTTNQPPNPPPNAVTTEHAHLRLPASQEASRAGWRSDQIIPAVTHIIDELGIDGQNLSYEILLDVLVQLYSANDAPNLGSDRSEGSVDSNHGGQSSDGVVDSSIPTLRFPQDVSASEKLRTLNDGVEVADSAEPAPVTTAGPATAATTTSRHNDQEQFRAVENEHNYLTQRSLCGICHQRPLHCVFLPCGHVIACQECAEAATKCPICNKNVAATANVYLS
ncbi:baculoviral IAP repeat-containing protein 2-like isoform X2 [Physella acuta]|uniref:baculoviral IAP repeat-containing protein 2-like isoform X2 n=1 Tax=Physella acuta TaxID=109671 RepID=UPI0027DDBB22|nr:baculoviral IAP repeat-containing protein 2-like isoform X2 [Physella acuta]